MLYLNTVTNNLSGWVKALQKCKGQEFRDHEQIVRQQQKVDFVAATYSHYTFLMNRIE